MMLPELRDQIDAINQELVSLLGKRLEVAKQIARVKKEAHLPIDDPEREQAIQVEIARLAKEHNLSVPIVQELFQLLIDYTKLEMEVAQ